MSEKILKPHDRKKQRFALKAFLWGAAIAAVFIIPSMIIDKGMYLYYGDYNFQVIPFYENMVRSIHSGELGWNWYTDLGSSFVGSYSFYNLGSPFFWVLLLFPAKAVPYVMGPLTIVKFGLSSLTAYIYLKRYTKNRNNAVLGALLYAFSGAAIYNMVFHFIDAMVVFPLLLAALDAYIFEDKRGLFAGAAALCALTNYYLFAAEAVFCVLYWLVRVITKSYKTDARSVLYLIIEAILGVGIAALLMLPTVYHFIGNNRANADLLNGYSFWAYDTGYVYLNTFIAFFLPPEPAQLNVYVPGYDHTWSSITAYLPLFGMSGVFAVVFNKHRNKWIRVFYAVCAIFMFIPVLNSSFQMFTNFKYTRWFFMLLLIMALGSVMALEDPSTKWKKAIIANLCITTVIIAAIGFTPIKSIEDESVLFRFGLEGDAPRFWTLAITALVNIVLFSLFIMVYKKDRELFKKFGSIILTASLLVTIGSTYITEKIYGEKHNPITCGLMEPIENADIDDINVYRTEMFDSWSYSNKGFDSNNLETDDLATIDNEAAQYLNDLKEKDEDKWNITDPTNGTLFWEIPSFGVFHSMVNSSITDFYGGNDRARGTISTIPIGEYGYRSILSTKYIFDLKDSLSFTDEQGDPYIPGWKYLKTWNNYDIYENEYVVPYATKFSKYMISTDFEKVPTVYKHLVLLDTVVIDSVDMMFEMTALGMKQTFPSDYSDEDFSEEAYYKYCEDRRAAGCENFARDKKGFEFTISADDSDEYVFVGVPYDNGWSATVNGEKAKIEKADFGFMMVRIPAGTASSVRFDFHTRGTIYGTFVTVICLLMLLIYLGVVKMRKTSEEKAAARKESGGGTSEQGKDEPKPDKPDGGDKKEEAAEEDSETLSEKESEEEGAEAPAENEPEEEDLDNMSVFDIVKETEENTMMHVYKRVPVVLERGIGSVGYDINNKKYIDFTSGIGVNALGYADGRWGEAVERQIYDVQHTSNLYYNTTQISLAEMLCMKTGFSKVFFANSGAEANECAIKIARKYGSDRFGEKHTHIITLENSFHGRTITTLSATGQDVFHKYFTPFTEGFSFAKANDMESVKACTTEDTCAVMIELIQGEGGVNPLDKKFVTDLAQYCKDNDLLLIVDEIQTGVGRTGRLYCYENFGIQPDVITSAKALSGGLPLSACMCTERLKDVMTPGSNGTTFGGNPIACAGALKILDIVADDKFLAEVRAKGAYMRERIKEMKGVKEVRGMGMMIGIVLEKDNAGEVLGKCAENGLLVLTAKGLIRLLPPLNIEYEDIDEGLDILESTILSTL